MRNDECIYTYMCGERRGGESGEKERDHQGKVLYARTKISIILFYEFTRSDEC